VIGGVLSNSTDDFDNNIIVMATFTHFFVFLLSNFRKFTYFLVFINLAMGLDDAAHRLVKEVFQYIYDIIYVKHC
jgi:hypothetical protein